MLTNLISVSVPYQVTATVSNSVSASSTLDYAINIDRNASVALATVVSSSLILAPYDGYSGDILILRPGSGLGRASSLMTQPYVSAYDSSLISRLSTEIFGTSIRLDNAWINNPTSQLIFQFRNTSASIQMASCRITALVFP